MKIEKYFLKKNNINRTIVVYSKNDLLLPYLQLLLKNLRDPNKLTMSFLKIKKGKTQLAVAISLYTSLYNEKYMTQAEKLIEDNFKVQIKELVSIKKIISIQNKIDKYL